MSTVVKRHMTAADLERMPSDDFRYELVNGELRQMPPSGFEHGDKTMRLSAPLAVFVYANDLGVVTAAETGFKIDDYDVRAPDFGFISNERLQQFGKPKKGFYPYAPDLAVEVISLGDTKAEVQEKVQWWLMVGTRLVLVADPKRQIVTAHHAASNSVKIFRMGDVLDCMDVVPGFTLPVADIFK